MKKWRGIFLRVAISLGSLGLILFSLRGKLGDSLAILKNEVVWSWFLLAVISYAAGLGVLAFRLRSVLKIQGILLDIAETFYLNFVGLFFNLFFPSAVGGDVAKAYYAYKHSGKKIASTTSVLLDRLMGFVALIGMAMVSVLLFSKRLGDPRIDRFVYLAVAFMLLTVVFFSSKRFAKVFKFLIHLIPSKKWQHRCFDIYHAIYAYKKRKAALLTLILLSLIGQSFFIMVHYYAARGLGVEMAPWLFFILVPMISVVSMAPSIGGLGVREAGMVYFFKPFMPSERAFALSLLMDVLIYGYSFLAGIIFSFRGGLKARMMNEMEDIQ